MNKSFSDVKNSTNLKVSSIPRSIKYFRDRRRIKAAIQETKFNSNTDDFRPYGTVVIEDSEYKGLLDSGASISAFGAGSEKFLTHSKFHSFTSSSFVSTASGNKQRIFGYLKLPVTFKGKTEIIQLFVIPSLTQILYLGIDFWNKFSLKPAFVEECSKPSFETTILSSVFKNLNLESLSHDRHHLTNEQQVKLRETIAFFPSSAVQGLGKTSLTTHKITLINDAKPVKQRLYSVSPAVQAEINLEIDRMLKLGVIEESESPWCSPMAVVRKANGKTRLCLDARKLNDLTVKDAYPIPLIDGLLSRLGGTHFISSIDLKDAFWQIPLSPESRPYTAFAVPGRPLYQFTVMPFGLCNAPQSLSRLMSYVIPHQLQDKVFVYLDDLLIVSSSFAEHISLLSDVAARLVQAGLTINIDKSKFLMREIEYLGFVVGEGCIRPNPEKVVAISEFPAPKNVRQVRRFLGMTGWYMRFISNYSTLAAPLTELLKKSKKFEWLLEAQTAFENLKNSLITAPVLSNPDYSRKFFIQCDASSTGVGSVLYQVNEEGMERPIAYMSRKLNGAQRNYNVTEQECLAAVLSVRKFRHYVEGYHFTIVTDHASLKWLMSQRDLHGRLARWALQLQSYNFDIQHRKGSDNTVPDTLSRAFTEEINKNLFASVTSDSLHIDINAPDFKSPVYVDWVEKVKLSNEQTNLRVVDNKIYINVCPSVHAMTNDLPQWKLVVPSSLTQRLIERSHNPPSSAHRGISKTVEILKRHYFWKTLVPDVKNFINSCTICKSTKAPNFQMKPPMGQHHEVFRPWQKIYVDFLGPYPRSKGGNTCILIIVDAYSRYVMLEPIRQATASILGKFLEHRVFSIFGVPQFIVSDNGRQFESHILAQLLAKYGVVHIFTAKYSPQSNASERVNRSVLAAIRAYVAGCHQNWDEHLSEISLALCDVVHESTQFSPHFLVFGQHVLKNGANYELLRSLYEIGGNFVNYCEKGDHLSLVQKIVISNFKAAYAKNAQAYNLRSRVRNFEDGQMVLVRNFRQSDAAQKYSAKLDNKFVKAKIIRRCGSVAYECEDDNGKKIGVYHTKDIRAM